MDETRLKTWLHGLETGKVPIEGRAAEAHFSGLGGGTLGSNNTWWNGGFFFGSLPGSQRDFQKEAGILWLNSAVSICLDWVTDNYTEASLECETQGTDGSRQRSRNHRLLTLLQDPNNDYGFDELMAVTILCEAVYGDAYWLIGRAKTGPKQLWWLPSWEVRPRWDSAGKNFITHYEQFVDGRRYTIDKRDVIHFRKGIDPYNPRHGMSRLKALLREIVTDNGVTTFTAGIVQNLGVPGVIISPASSGDELMEEDADNIREDWSENQTGDNAGRPMVLSRPIRVDRLALNPSEMSMRELGVNPEARIAAAFRIPALVVGFASGDDVKTYANMHEAQKLAYHNGIFPLQKRHLRTINRRLLPQMGDPSRERIVWNYEDVECLREQPMEKANRITRVFMSNLIQQNEGRTELGYKPTDDGERLYAQIVGQGIDTNLMETETDTAA